MELPIRTRTELDSMREAGRVVAAALAAVAERAVPGAKLKDLDDVARTVLHQAGARPSFLGYAPSWAPTPFNGVLCLSPNELVVHGRPSGRRTARPSSRRSAMSNAGRRVSMRASGASRARASQGMARMPPASTSATAR